MKLTKAQEQTLRSAVAYYGFLRANPGNPTCLALRKLGYMRRTIDGFQITDAGRAALSAKEGE